MTCVFCGTVCVWVGLLPANQGHDDGICKFMHILVGLNLYRCAYIFVHFRREHLMVKFKVEDFCKLPTYITTLTGTSISMCCLRAIVFSLHLHTHTVETVWLRLPIHSLYLVSLTWFLSNCESLWKPGEKASCEIKHSPPVTSQSRMEMFPRQTWEPANTKGTDAEQACTNMQTQATECHLCSFGFRRRRNSEDKPNNLLSLIKAV